MSDSINILFSENKIAITLRDKNINKYGNGFLIFMSIFMVFFPIIIILWLSIGINFGSILSVLLAWFISSYFIKLLLWNLYGEEVIIIYKHRIETYFCYKYFMDNKMEYSFEKMELLAYIDNKAYFVNDLNTYTKSDGLSFIGFYLDGVKIVNSFHNIKLSKIIELGKSIDKLA